MSTALELSKEAFRCGYVKPEDREGPPSPESKMSAWQQDMDQWRQSEELWSAFADKAIAAVARLEDLRRWRLMSENPVGEIGLYLFKTVTERLEIGFFVECNDRVKWTYIPGQEPKESK